MLMTHGNDGDFSPFVFDKDAQIRAVRQAKGVAYGVEVMGRTRTWILQTTKASLLETLSNAPRGELVLFVCSKKGDITLTQGA